MKTLLSILGGLANVAIVLLAAMRGRIALPAVRT